VKLRNAQLFCCAKLSFHPFLTPSFLLRERLPASTAATYIFTAPACTTIIITSRTLLHEMLKVSAFHYPDLIKNFLTLRRTGSYFSSVTQHWFLLLQWITMPFFVHGF